MKNSKRIFSIGRRPFLAGLGAGGASMFLRPILAEAAGMFPERFVYIHWPVGTVNGLDFGATGPWTWFPKSGAGTNYVASTLLKMYEQAAPDMKYTFETGPSIRDKITFFNNLDLLEKAQTTKGDKHAQGIMGMGSGWMTVAVDGFPIDTQFDPPNAKKITIPKGTKTFDQMLVDMVPSLTAALMPGLMGPQYKSLQLCGTAKSMNGQGEACLKVLSYAGNNQPLWGEGRSDTAFNNIFGMAMMPGVDPVVFKRLQAQKRSVLDFVISDIQRMQPMVPAGQRPKLDAQLTSIRALEARITDTPPMTGQIVPPMLKTEPLTGHDGANQDEARHQMLCRNMMDIIRCALLSDLSRVISITFGDGNMPLRPKAYCPPSTFVISSDGHSVSHAGNGTDAVQAKGEVNAVYHGVISDWARKMAQTPEGTESLLDHTLGLAFSECNKGDDHSRAANPTILLGGKFFEALGHTLSRGYLNLSPARYTNDLMAAILKAWGAPLPNDVFGDPQYGKGAVPGVFAGI
jgi:hypothetical protein